MENVTSAAEGAAKGAGPFSHLEESGRAAMVDVAAKEVTEREAVAEAWLVMAPAHGVSPPGAHPSRRGDAIAAARLAGISSGQAHR